MKKSTLFVGLSALSLVAAVTLASAAPTNNVGDSSATTASAQGEGIITPMAVDNEIVNS